ncbi:MAG TPA: diguanylate cyclase [Lysobacter sp.]|nr:diguanylate cyclase [Lysobacter sp.]
MPSLFQSFDRRHLPLLLALLVLLAGVTAAMLLGIRSFDASARWVSHTYEVQRQIEAVRSALATVESTSRGFRLSGDPGLEAHYRETRALPLQRVDALLETVRDNPPQHARATALRDRVRQRLQQIDHALVLQAAGRVDDANRDMLARGVPMDAALDRIATEMSRHEERLLESRGIASARDSSRLRAVVLGGMFVSFAMLGLLLSMVSREARRAHRHEQEAREAVERLESAAVHRERLGEQRRTLAAFAGLLHSCQSVDEALEVAGNALAQLVPHGAGACYTMRASQNLLERHVLFGTDGAEYAGLMRPDQCWALRRGDAHAWDPQRPTAACDHLRGMLADQACGVCVPLTSQGAVLGLLHVSNRLGEPLGEFERAAVEAVGEHLGVVLHSLDLRDSLRMQSLRDPLTGLYNRRYLEESLPREVERCERRGRPLSVLMLDIDHFKRFNDEHGHAAGDALLARIGQVLATVTRGEDIACRYGGEEFTVVMPEADIEQATLRAEQILAAIADASTLYLGRELGPVTASLGVARLRSGRDTPETVMARADRALYAAKAQGRNRVLQAGDAETD